MASNPPTPMALPRRQPNLSFPRQLRIKRMEYVDLLDSSGRPTGRRKPKSEVHRDGDWHGAAHVWILNTEGQILIQRRSPTKENWPNLWDVSVAGHVSAGEGPVETAIREA